MHGVRFSRTLNLVLSIVAICVAVGVLLWCAIPRRTAAHSGVLGPIARDGPLAPESVRVATYNIHGSRGMDRSRDLSRTARVIQGADVAALQEVHADWRCSQAQSLGQMLAMGWLYTPTVRRWCCDHRGNALLSRFPIKHWQTYLLPNVAGRRYRNYTIAEIMLGEVVLSLLFTHLHTRGGRESQLRIVLKHFEGLPLPAMLMGDLNTRMDDPVLAQHLPAGSTDAIRSSLGDRDFTGRVDCIITRGLKINDGGFTPPGASDHPYFWVDVAPDKSPVVEPATVTP